MKFTTQDEFSIYCKKLIEDKGRNYYLEIPLAQSSIFENGAWMAGEAILLPNEIYVITDSLSVQKRRWFFYRSPLSPPHPVPQSEDAPTYWWHRIHHPPMKSQDGMISGPLSWLKGYSHLQLSLNLFMNWRINPLEVKQ